jgi:TetR/AcrR family tetracycline transcriptional repressor
VSTVPPARQPLDRAVVVGAALSLLDEVGLDGLTLRRLATELGVQAPALYWHYANKRELLDHMAQEIGERFGRFDETLPWDEAVTAYAHTRRQAMLAHRDGARVINGTRPAADSLASVEQAVAALVATGFTPVQAMRFLVSVGTFVGGFVSEEQAEARRNEEEGWTDEQSEQAFARIQADPGLPNLVRALREGGDPNGAETFEFGLQLLISGMRQALGRSA